MPVLMFVYLCLASYAVRQAWLYGSLFARTRARVQTWQGRLGELLTCRLCLSYHAPWLVLATLAGAPLLLTVLEQPEAAAWAQLPLQLLAATGSLLAVDRLTDNRKDRQTHETDYE